MLNIFIYFVGQNYIYFIKNKYLKKSILPDYKNVGQN